MEPATRPMSPWPIIVLILGLAGIGWFVYQHYRTPERCRDIQLAETMNDLGPGTHPPVRPSDAQWYNEHCFQGRPR